MDNFIMQRSHWSKEVNISIILLINVAQMASIQQNVMLLLVMEDSVLWPIDSLRNYISQTPLRFPESCV